MFSKLALIIKGEEVEFDASELIHLAYEVVHEQQVVFASKGEAKKQGIVSLPSYQVVDELLDKAFWKFTFTLSSKLEKNYQLEPGVVQDFLATAFSQPLLAIYQYSSLLDHIKKQEKVFEKITINDHIILPIQLIQLNTLGQWVCMAQHLASNHLSDEFLSGWWFEIGGRVVRLRNDVLDGEVIEGNKQFYASDHGRKTDIIANTSRDIYRCINNFPWSEQGGNYSRAFNFWQYFTLQDVRKSKLNFIENMANVKDESKEETFLSRLASPPIPPLPPLAKIDHLPASVRNKRENVFQQSLLRHVRQQGGMAIGMAEETWIKYAFIAGLTNEIASSEGACNNLLVTCFYQCFRPRVTPYHELPDKIKKQWGKEFDKQFARRLEQHQNCLRAEFVSHMNDSIADSPQQCLSFLMSLGHQQTGFRGTVDESKWTDRDAWQIGLRGVLTVPMLSRRSVSDAQEKRYGKIFDDLIEQFRYVTQALIRQRVEFMQQARNPFHTQIRQIMHEKMADQYIVVHTLYELAKQINRGKHDPLFRELSAYGDQEAGDSYQKFEPAVSAYLASDGALTEAQLAREMRAVLKGEAVSSEALAFLPCLTAAWFISESARNPLTTLTSLILLDMIERGVHLDTGDGDNWYSWRNVLIHPQKGKQGRVRDLYGKNINVDEFGSCHPMVHQGSVEQTKELPVLHSQLNIARQKEGNLLVHWLAIMINGLGKDIKAKYGVEQAIAKPTEKKAQSTKGNAVDEQSLTASKAQKEKQRNKECLTIRAKQQKDKQADVSKQQNKIEKLTKELEDIGKQLMILREKNAAKQIQKTGLIKKLLKLRLSHLGNLLRPQSAAVTPGSVSAPVSLLPAGFEEIDTPSDNHCLFWSVALALLLPRLDNEKDFQDMYLRLFGTGNVSLGGEEEKSAGIIQIGAQSTIEGVRNLLRTYDCQKDTPNQFEGEILNKLVTQAFRGRVVDRLDEAIPKEDRIAALADRPPGTTWEQYKGYMRNAVFGGEPEIRAISLLAQVSISAFSSLLPRPQTSVFFGSTETVFLVHVNASGKVDRSKNHYHFGLFSALYEKHHNKKLSNENGDRHIQTASSSNSFCSISSALSSSSSSSPSSGSSIEPQLTEIAVVNPNFVDPTKLLADVVVSNPSSLSNSYNSSSSSSSNIPSSLPLSRAAAKGASSSSLSMESVLVDAEELHGLKDNAEKTALGLTPDPEIKAFFQAFAQNPAISISRTHAAFFTTTTPEKKTEHLSLPEPTTPKPDAKQGKTLVDTPSSASARFLPPPSERKQAGIDNSRVTLLASALTSEEQQTQLALRLSSFTQQRDLLQEKQRIRQTGSTEKAIERLDADIQQLEALLSGPAKPDLEVSP